MAGTIIADYIRSDANKISLNVGNTTIASINASGILSNTGTTLIAPDGTFVANNITSGILPIARISDGGISTIKIADQAVSNTKLGVGTVLQVQNYTISGTTQSWAASTTTEQELTTWGTLSFTKLRSNSLVVGHVHFYNYHDGSPNAWWGLRCKNNGTYVTSSDATYSAIWTHNPVHYTWRQSAHQQWQTHFWDSTSGTSASFKFYHMNMSGTTTGGGMVWWNNPVRITLMEIAQ